MKEKRWNILETVILVYGYYLYESNQLTKQEVVEEISKKLRLYAKNNGQIFDDKYRNINGISMKFENIKYLFTNGESGLKNYAKQEKEIYDLFVQNKNEFKAHLNDAINKYDLFKNIDSLMLDNIDDNEENDFSFFTEELRQFEQIHSGKVKGYTDEELEEKENEEFDYSQVSSSSTSHRIPTDDRLKATCLEKAKYLCEINHEHITFTNTSGIHPYMECHHLIPVKAQKYFPKLKLDSMFNLVSLCPICHAQMHYGDSDAKAKVFWDIYEKRKELFKEKGIDEKKMKEIFDRFYK